MSTNKFAFKICSWFSGAIVILLLITTLGGLIINGLYRDATWYAVQARGQDLATLIIGVPLLVVSLAFMMRGSERALLVWLGSLAYILYTYLTDAFSVVFNAFFLLYVALVSLSFFTLTIALLNIDADALRRHFGARTPVKVVSGYLLVVVTLVFLAWMREILPALLTGQIPQSITLARIPSNPIYVLDLSVLLPSIFLAAIWLWRHRAWGYVLCGMFLVKVFTLSLAILSLGWFMYQSNLPGLDPVVVGFWVLLAVTSLVLAVIYLANLREGGERVLGTAVQ